MLKKNHEGFTIIEVLIVLAIAGLIMLIVFMAVPALQRNSRNTQRKNDISAILGSVAEYVSNNQGGLPKGTLGPTFSANFVGTAPKLGYYVTPENITYLYSATPRTGTVFLPPGTTDTVAIYNYLKCDGNKGTKDQATARSIAVLYNIEGSSAEVAQCQES
ncbi:MAG: type II secretion system protein [Candidatus Saccharibacteria bacterium]